MDHIFIHSGIELDFNLEVSQCVIDLNIDHVAFFSLHVYREQAKWRVLSWLQTFEDVHQLHISYKVSWTKQNNLVFSTSCMYTDGRHSVSSFMVTCLICE